MARIRTSFGRFAQRASGRFLNISIATCAAFAATALVRAQSGDFNGDHIDDLAIGVPGDTVMGLGNAGSVNIIYGRGAGYGLDLASPRPAGLLYQDILGGVSGAGDRFGNSLAIGDFDGDGFDDLAIGAFNKTATGAGLGEGSVTVVFGSLIGLTSSSRSKVLTQAALRGVAGVANEYFGAALAAGDFDGDKRDDLAIGIPKHDDGAIAADIGAVCVVFGHTAVPLSPARMQLLLQPTSKAANNRFGGALVAANVDCDPEGCDDLMVGVDGQTVFAVEEGTVFEFHGLFGYGPDPVTAIQWDQWMLGGAGIANDHFGWSLSAGDYDNNGAMDIAIGVPHKDPGGIGDAGAVWVVYSACPIGLQVGARPPDYWTQAAFTAPADEVSGAADLFGFTLASGDFDGNGLDDLAIGQPGEDRPGGANQNGGLTVHYSDPGVMPPGLVAPMAGSFVGQYWDQNIAGVPGVNALDDCQGGALAAGDFNADGRIDLVFGTLNEDIGGAVNAGCVNSLYGRPAAFGGLSAAAPIAAELFSRAAGVPGGLGNYDSLGTALTSNR